MKFKNWDGKSLKGDWMFTIKIDGIQGRKMTYTFGSKINTLVSKNNTSLNNLPKIISEGQIFEIFNGDCGDTWSVLSGPEGERKQITKKQIYKLFPVIDERLILVKKISNPTTEQIQSWFTKVRFDGHEGLVLRRLDKEVPFIKVKAVYTIDVKITGFKEGKGKFKGMLGKFLTLNGGIGVGMTNNQRKHFWRMRKFLINTTIEVKCMEITKNNKFRQPRFVKLRPDK